MLLIFTLFVLGFQPAFAYIDPGSGSAIMSIIIGFFVSIGVLVKTFWYKIKSFFSLSISKNLRIKSNKDRSDCNYKNK